MNEVITGKLECESCLAPLPRPIEGNVVECEYCGTKIVVSDEVKTVVAKNTQSFQVALRNAIGSQFDDKEIDELIFALNSKVPHPHVIVSSTISNGSPNYRAMLLVQWCNRRAMLQTLLDAVYECNPTFQFNHTE